MDPKQLNITKLYEYEQENTKSLGAKCNPTSPRSFMSISWRWEFRQNFSNFCQFLTKNVGLSLEYSCSIPKIDFFAWGNHGLVRKPIEPPGKVFILDLSCVTWKKNSKFGQEKKSQPQKWSKLKILVCKVASPPKEELHTRILLYLQNWGRDFFSWHSANFDFRRKNTFWHLAAHIIYLRSPNKLLKCISNDFWVGSCICQLQQPATTLSKGIYSQSHQGVNNTLSMVYDTTMFQKCWFGS